MKLSCLTNERGVTLTELIVAMAITSILLVLIISGSLFVKDYIKRWQGQDKLVEEVVFIQKELTSNITTSHKISIHNDSISFITADCDNIRYTFEDNLLYKNGNNLIRAGFNVTQLQLQRIELSDHPNDSILTNKYMSGITGLYKLNIRVSDDRGNTESLQTLVRNKYETYKYSSY